MPLKKMDHCSGGRGLAHATSTNQAREITSIMAELKAIRSKGFRPIPLVLSMSDSPVFQILVRLIVEMMF
jgi:hypothetical protein